MSTSRSPASTRTPGSPECAPTSRVALRARRITTASGPWSSWTRLSDSPSASRAAREVRPSGRAARMESRRKERDVHRIRALRWCQSRIDPGRDARGAVRAWHRARSDRRDLSGEEVRLSEGPLVDAVMASAAIPGVLPAVSYAGRLLMDGGVANNSPLSHALELGADRVYVLPTGSTCELDEPPRGALSMFLYATHLLLGRRLADEIAALESGADVIVLPPPCPLRVQPTDFSHADDLIEQARHDSRRMLLRPDPRRPAAARPRRRPRGSRRGRPACVQPGGER